jgi:hypothetical protein
MEFTTFKQEVIYRQREKLDDFGINNSDSLDYILEYELFKLYRTWPGYKNFAINIFNTAYYVCTMALADNDPMRSFGDYLQRVNEITQDNKDQTALVLSMVLIIIDAHKWKRTKSGMDNLAIQILYEINENDFIRYSYYEQAKHHYESRADRTILSSDDEFKPRPINYKLLANNYSVEDLKNLFGTDEDKVLDFIFTLGKDEEEQYIIASFMEDQMHSFFADSWRHKAFFDYVKSNIHTKFHGEEERAQMDAQIEEELMKEYEQQWELDYYKEEFPKLKAENARLLEENEELKKIHLDTFYNEQNRIHEDKEDMSEDDINEDMLIKSEVADLKQEIVRLKNDLEAFKTPNGKIRMTASQAATFLLTVCHHLGQLPNNKKKLTPILERGWNFTEKTASRALGSKTSQKVANETASIFEDISPKLARLIKEFPQTFETIRINKLKANNNKKVKND